MLRWKNSLSKLSISWNVLLYPQPQEKFKPNELENVCQSSGIFQIANEISLQYRKRREIKYKFNYRSTHKTNRKLRKIGKNLFFVTRAKRTKARGINVTLSFWD